MDSHIQHSKWHWPFVRVAFLLRERRLAHHTQTCHAMRRPRTMSGKQTQTAKCYIVTPTAPPKRRRVRLTIELPECPICFERFDEENPAARYWCGHAYHALCAESWFLRSLLCPTCDREIGGCEPTIDTNGALFTPPPLQRNYRSRLLFDDSGDDDNAAPPLPSPPPPPPPSPPPSQAASTVRDGRDAIGKAPPPGRERLNRRECG